MARNNIIDKEDMYRKIMPTGIKPAEISSDTEQISKIQADLDKEPSSLIQSKKTQNFFSQKEALMLAEKSTGLVIINITEKLVLSKLDISLKRMSCCKCDRCKKDIIALTLNNLSPRYIVATNGDAEKIISENEQTLDVTAAILKAVLTVRKSPRH